MYHKGFQQGDATRLDEVQRPVVVACGAAPGIVNILFEEPARPIGDARRGEDAHRGEVRGRHRQRMGKARKVGGQERARAVGGDVVATAGGGATNQCRSNGLFGQCSLAKVSTQCVT